MRLYKKVVFFFLTLMVCVVLFFAFNKVERSVAKCASLQAENDRAVCLAKYIRDVVAEKGVGAGLELVYTLSMQNDDFSNNCHDYIHIVGNAAHDKFVLTGEVDITNYTTICAYGFYHGFMESLVSTSGDVKVAQDFCQKVRIQVPSANLACFHGIGHGWAGTHDKSLWGDEMAMVAPALEMCEKVTDDPHELKICATGVFDSISIGYYNRLYGLEIRKDDPFWLCRAQAEKYKEPCYMDLVPAVVWLGGYEMLPSLSFVEKTEYGYRDLVVEKIADNMVRFTLNRKEDLFNNVLVCRSLERRYVESCLKGVVSGAVQFGQPEIEYKQGLDLCEDARMKSAEKEICLKVVMNYSLFSYSKEKFDKICGIDPSYEKHCESLR